MTDCFRSKILLAAMAGIALLTTCARMGAPPGGPEDLTPPEVEGVVPDMDSTNVDPDTRIRITFSEKVRTDQAERLISVEPDPGRLYLDWEGRTVDLRTDSPLRPGITYRVRVDSGLVDMHRVASRERFVSYFSTGRMLSPGRIRGRLTRADSSVAGATVRAAAAADSMLAFTARSDSAGRYNLPYLPLGDYRVLAFRDDNRNGRFDYTREPGADTLATVGVEPAELDIELRIADTTGPALSNVETPDSLTIELVFDDPLDTLRALTDAEITLRTPDSTGATVELDSVYLDSTDTRRIILRPSAPLVPERRYFVRVGGLYNRAGLSLDRRRNTAGFYYRSGGAAAPGGRGR